MTADKELPSHDIETEFTRFDRTFHYTFVGASLFERGLPVTHKDEKESRPGFLQSAPGQVILLIAVVVVMLLFAWSFI